MCSSLKPGTDVTRFLMSPELPWSTAQSTPWIEICFSLGESSENEICTAHISRKQRFHMIHPCALFQTAVASI